MPDVKVFLSSTYRDLKDHREAVRKAIGKLRGFTVVGMEDFGSQNGHAKAVCLRELEACHAYVGVFAWYYGTIPDGDECSLTEAEYRAAAGRGLPRLLFIADKGLSIHPDLVEDDAKRAKRKAFHDDAMSYRVVDFFVTPDDLATKVVAALQKEFSGAAVAPKSANAPLHQLPSDVPDFTGRAKELDELLTALDRDGTSAAVVTAIRGMGGIGKTTLAVHAARRLTARYPDAQIVVDLQGYGDAEPLTPIDAMAKVVQAFDPGFKPVDDAGQMAAHYRSVLEGRRALILLDNAPANADLRALVPPPPCGLIVTAREPVRIDGAKSIALGLLTRTEALELLRAAAGRADVADADWKRIAALCGDLPLALRVAASFLAEGVNWTAAAYIEALADERTRLDTLRLEGMPDRDVGAVLSLSAQALVGRDGAAAARWQMLSVFPASFDEEAAAAVWDTDPTEARRTLTALLTSALLLFDTDERRYRLHDLLRPIARQVFAMTGVPDPEPGSEARLRLAAVRHARHFKDVLAAADNLFLRRNDGVLAGLRLYDVEAENIAATAFWAMEHSDSDPDATELAAHLPSVGIYVLDLRLHRRQLITWLDGARRAASLLKLRPLEGGHLGNLGSAYANIGKTRIAIEYFEQALAIAREIGDRRSEGRALGNLGNAYTDLGESQRAIEHFEQALDIARKIGDRRGEGALIGNLGNAYANLGEARCAREHYEQALAIARENGDRHGEGNHLGNLGAHYFELDEVRPAIEYFGQALAIAREIGDRHGEGNHLGNLGSAHATLGEVQLAIEHFEQALAIAREIGDRHGEGNNLGNLGSAYAALGGNQRAITFGEQAIAILEEIESPNTAVVRNWIAEWRIAQEDNA